MKSQNKQPFAIGNKVTYQPFSGGWEQGIIKSYNRYGNPFVVYHCDDNWDNYEDYTGALTPLDKLVEGWIEEDMVDPRNTKGTAEELGKKVSAYIESLGKDRMKTGEKNLFNQIPEPPYNSMIWKATCLPGMFHCRIDQYRVVNFYLAKNTTRIEVYVQTHMHNAYKSGMDPLNCKILPQSFILLSDEEIKHVYELMMPGHEAVLDSLLFNQKE